MPDFFHAPKRTRASTGHTAHKALNLSLVHRATVHPVRKPDLARADHTDVSGDVFVAMGVAMPREGSGGRPLSNKDKASSRARAVGPPPAAVVHTAELGDHRRWFLPRRRVTRKFAIRARMEPPGPAGGCGAKPRALELHEGVT